MHTMHRGLMSRVFTPRRMAALEDQVRAFCVAASTRSSAPTASTSSPSSAPMMPMRVIGMLLGIPEQDQVAVRDKTDADLRTEPGQADGGASEEHVANGDMFADYIEWRAEHPSDDLMTQLLNAEFEDENGETRTLTRDEVLTYTAGPRRRRQRDHRPAHRLARQAARRAPRPAARGRRGPLADPERDRRDAALRADRPRHRPLRRRRTSSTTAPPSRPAAPILLLVGVGQPRPAPLRATPTSSTSTATTSSTSPSASASTSASAPASPGSKAGSRSTSC